MGQPGRTGRGLYAPSPEERVCIENDDRRREQPDLHREDRPSRQDAPYQQRDDQDDRDHDRIVDHIETDEQTKEVRGIRCPLRDHPMQREDNHGPPDNQAGHLRRMRTMLRLMRRVRRGVASDSTRSSLTGPPRSRSIWSGAHPDGRERSAGSDIRDRDRAPCRSARGPSWNAGWSGRPGIRNRGRSPSRTAWVVSCAITSCDRQV